MPDSQKISEKQSEYMNLIAEIMDIRKRGEKPVAYIRTYGCQQNVADSEKIKGMLEQSGFEFSDEPDNADFILFNTCAVREHAEDRVFGNVGALKNLKRKHPQILIALCGCMMEQEHVANKIYKSFPFSRGTCARYWDWTRSRPTVSCFTRLPNRPSSTPSRRRAIWT